MSFVELKAKKIGHSSHELDCSVGSPFFGGIGRWGGGLEVGKRWGGGQPEQSRSNGTRQGVAG